MTGRSRDDVVADPLDVEVGISTQDDRDVVRDRRFTVTHGVDGDQRERVVESTHVATPCSRKMSLSLALL